MKNFMAIVIAFSAFLLLSCGETGIESAQSRYEQTSWFYQEDTVREIRITINTNSLRDIVLANYGNSPGEKEYALAASITIDGESTTNIGIRSRGNTSANNWKRQFKISFDCTNPLTNASATGYALFPEYDDRRFHGTKKLNLRASQNDPTIIREKIAAYIMRQAGALVPRVGFAKVYVNDAYWGLYLVVEQIDKTFLDAHLNEKSGNLYKAEWNGFTPCFLVGHEDSFALKTNKDLNDKTGLTAFFNGLASATTAAETALLANTDNIINYYAAATLVGHWDSFTFGQNNDYLYHHSDGKFRIITWDLDNTFGSEWTSGTSILDTSIYQMRNNENYQALFKKILDDPTYRTQYQTKLRTLLGSCFNSPHLFAKIDAWKATIQDATLADERKNRDWGGVDAATGNRYWNEGFYQKPTAWSGNGFNNDGLGLKPWISGRIARVQAELDSTAPADSDGNTSFATAQAITIDSPIYGGITGDVDSDYYALTISSSAFHEITLQNLGGNFTLTIYDASRTEITNSNNTGTTDESAGLVLAAGTYYIKVSPETGETGSYTLNAGSHNSIEVSIALGSGFQDKSGTYGYWIMPSGTSCTISAIASDSNTSISHVEFYLDTNLWATVSNAPYQLSYSFPAGNFFFYNVSARAYNTAGQHKESTPSPTIRLYTSDYQDPEDNGDGTFTFRVNPLHIPGGATNTPVYLPGEMNGWGGDGDPYLVANQLTNRGDGVLTLTTTTTSGKKYKFNVDFDKDGVRDNDEWWVSPANPYLEQSGNHNNIIP